MFRVRFFTTDNRTWTFDYATVEDAVSAISDAFEVGLVVEAPNKDFFYPAASIKKAEKREVPVA